MTRANALLVAHADAVLLYVQTLTVLAVACLLWAVTAPMATWGEG